MSSPESPDETGPSVVTPLSRVVSDAGSPSAEQATAQTSVNTTRVGRMIALDGVTFSFLPVRRKGRRARFPEPSETCRYVPAGLPGEFGAAVVVFGFDLECGVGDVVAALEYVSGPVEDGVGIGRLSCHEVDCGYVHF